MNEESARPPTNPRALGTQVAPASERAASTLGRSSRGAEAM
jgi:hypothetical protein